MKSAIRTLGDLGEDIILAPERWIARDNAEEDGPALGELVTLRGEKGDGIFVVLDTTHARDGVLDIAAALRAPATAKSAKKGVRAGDVIISRLRPYLRQIAYVHPAIGESLAVSSEFYVLAPRGRESLAFLVPFLLGERVQAVLAAAQEGGHHPRVPRESLLAIRVPAALIEQRAAASKAVIRALDDVYGAASRWSALVAEHRLPHGTK